MSADEAKAVLILGAGVHGAATARELASNGVAVHVVDAFDIAFGATSKSSRLIHGGLRYLEYGDFRLVRESLEARHWNLTLAPQFVRPLRLFIPTKKRWSGLWRSAAGFLGVSRTTWGRRWTAARVERGYWPVRIGLWMYDRLRRFGRLPGSASMSVGTPGTPAVNSSRYRWLCAYFDAQMLYPERLVTALLTEAQDAAARRGVPFRVSTYSLAECVDGRWQLRDVLAGSDAAPLSPTCVVNATGAWGDATLERLKAGSPPLFGGTKGTHFVTWNDELRHALRGDAVYAEADDGRLVFILPFGEGALVGTTDETFAARPETAVATDEELDYLLRMVSEVMACRLTRADVALHYSGVRPLPRSSVGDNAAISRDHAIVAHEVGGCPLLTLVGGKLTTWREFSREVSDRVLQHCGTPRRVDMAMRPVKGSEAFPESEMERAALWSRYVADFGVSEGLVATLWPLYGTRTADVLRGCRDEPGGRIRGTDWTSSVVRWVIDHEWVRTVSDLIERRLMLVFARRLVRETIIDLARCLVEAGKLTEEALPGAVDQACQRLSQHYGRRVEEGED